MKGPFAKVWAGLQVGPRQEQQGGYSPTPACKGTGREPALGSRSRESLGEGCPKKSCDHHGATALSQDPVEGAREVTSHLLPPSSLHFLH